MVHRRDGRDECFLRRPEMSGAWPAGPGTAGSPGDLPRRAGV